MFESIKNILGQWEKCDPPSWMDMDRAERIPIENSKIVRGRHYIYKLAHTTKFDGLQTRHGIEIFRKKRDEVPEGYEELIG